MDTIGRLAQLVFTELDLNGNGFISRAELEFFLAALPQEDGIDTRKACQELFKGIDFNRDGVITFNEWQKFFTDGPKIA